MPEPQSTKRTTTKGQKILTPEIIQADCKVHGRTEHKVIENPVASEGGFLDISIKSCVLCCKDREVIEQERLDREERTRKATKQVVLNKTLDNAMITPRFKDKTFDNFDTPLEGQGRAIESCNWFIKNFDRSMGLIFIGKSGTGKNHLACALVKETILQLHKTALITKSIKLLRRVKESWRRDGEFESDVLKQFTMPDLLVIDEIGVQFGSETEKNILTEIIDDRYEEIKPTILIGNLELPEMREIVGDRAIERFKEGGRIVVFDWESWRGKTNKMEG